MDFLIFFQNRFCTGQREILHEIGSEKSSKIHSNLHPCSIGIFLVEFLVEYSTTKIRLEIRVKFD